MLLKKCENDEKYLFGEFDMLEENKYFVDGLNVVFFWFGVIIYI